MRKSSFLNASLLPKARQSFNVIECRIADDPFGKLLSALSREPYRKGEESVRRELVAEALTAAAEIGNSGALVDSENAKPLLVCIDQFEELFTTVKDEIRNQFFETLKDAMKKADMKLIIATRGDFFDLLMKLSDSVDPERETITLGNYYTLRAFRKAQAKAVLSEILAPVHAENPLLEQQIEDFTEALIRELLRPPRDKRLCKDDEKTVLPVELQTVGMMIEASGVRSFSVAGLKRLGGKLGLLRAYIEDAKTYVFRKTAVSGEKALLVLRQLISPSQTKWAQSPQTIAVNVNLPPLQVKKVLDAFADKYLVYPLPIATDDVGTETLAPVQQYELMHEHLVQILREAPDPILQKARDAEERLRFWNERTKASNKAPTMGKLRSLLARIASLLAQPIPLIESLTLWRFAHLGDEQRILKRSLRGFCFRLAVVTLLVILPLTAWEFWSRTDAYQVRAILADSPASQLGFTTDDDRIALIKWLKALVYVGKVNKAVDTVHDMKDTGVSSALFAIADALLKAGNPDKAKGLLREALQVTSTDKSPDVAGPFIKVASADEALQAAREIKDEAPRDRAMIAIARALITAGKADEALRAASEIKAQRSRNSALLSIAEALIRERDTDRAKGALGEALRLTRDLEADSFSSNAFCRIADAWSSLGDIDKAKGILSEAQQAATEIKGDDDRGVALTSIAETLVKFGRFDEALQAFGKIKDQDSRYAGTMEALVGAGKLDAALQALGKIEDEVIRSGAIYDNAEAFVRAGNASETLRLVGITIDSDPLSAIFEALIKAGNPDVALKATIKIEDEEIRSNVLSQIADALIAVGLVVETLKAADTIGNKVLRSRVFFIIAGRLISSGKIDEGLQAVRQITEDESRLTFLSGNAEALMNAGKFDESLSTARQIGNESTRARALSVLAERMIKMGKTDEALYLAQEIKLEVVRPSALSAIAVALIKAGEADRAKGVLIEVLPLVVEIKDDNTRSKALCAIGEAWIKVDEILRAREIFNEALQTASKIRGDATRSEAFSRVGRGFARSGAFRLARLAGDLCKSSKDRLSAYTTILTEYVKQKSPNLRTQIEADEKTETPARKTPVSSKNSEDPWDRLLAP
jgi:tetratricopeptide (TPR) repeat protein